MYLGELSTCGRFKPGREVVGQVVGVRLSPQSPAGRVGLVLERGELTCELVIVAWVCVSVTVLDKQAVEHASVRQDDIGEEAAVVLVVARFGGWVEL